MITAVAWIVPACPDFFFMPTFTYDQVFSYWDNNSWDCPKAWKDKGKLIVSCYATENEQEADIWVVNDGRRSKQRQDPMYKHLYPISLWQEALVATREHNSITMLNFEKFTLITEKCNE